MKVSRTIRGGGHSVPSGIASEHPDAYNNYDIPSQGERREERVLPLPLICVPYCARIVPLFPSFTPWARRSAHIRPPSSSTTPRVLSDPQGVGARPCLLYRPPTIREVGRTRPSAFVEAHTAYLFVRVLPSLQKESGYPLLDLPSSLSLSRRSLPHCAPTSRRAAFSFVPHVALGSHHSEERKRQRSQVPDFSEPSCATDRGCENTMGIQSPKAFAESRDYRLPNSAYVSRRFDARHKVKISMNHKRALLKRNVPRWCWKSQSSNRFFQMIFK